MKFVVDEMPYYMSDCPFCKADEEVPVCTLDGETCRYLHPWYRDMATRDQQLCTHLCPLSKEGA